MSENGDSSLGGVPTAIRQPAPTDEPITLQAGEQRFTTLLSTLTSKSPWFRAFFSGNLKDARLPSDAYLIDADASLFAHILNYLRRGVFPIFHNIKTGHDRLRYVRLLEEARYFQIQELVKWLEEEVYLRAVKTSYVTDQAQGLEALATLLKGEREWVVYPTFGTKR
ncbi:BTB/POZ domain-containing protein KCTD9, partial [Lachnellula suecica]